MNDDKGWMISKVGATVALALKEAEAWSPSKSKSLMKKEKGRLNRLGMDDNNCMMKTDVPRLNAPGMNRTVYTPPRCSLIQTIESREGDCKKI